MSTSGEGQIGQKRSRQRVCLFGGTFDPIHNAHLLIASEAQRAFSLNQILFVPSAQPPHKDQKLLTPFEDRFRMVQLACTPYSKFKASRLEAQSGPSYTVDTLERFTREDGQGQNIFFLIGSDAFDELSTWKRWEDLLKLADFIVVSRPGARYHVPEGARVHELDHLALPVSSSSIRERLADGADTPELPAEVRAYIDKHGLYGKQREEAISGP